MCVSVWVHSSVTTLQGMCRNVNVFFFCCPCRQLNVTVHIHEVSLLEHINVYQEQSVNLKKKVNKIIGHKHKHREEDFHPFVEEEHGCWCQSPIIQPYVLLLHIVFANVKGTNAAFYIRFLRREIRVFFVGFLECFLFCCCFFFFLSLDP